MCVLRGLPSTWPTDVSNSYFLLMQLKPLLSAVCCCWILLLLPDAANESTLTCMMQFSHEKSGPLCATSAEFAVKCLLGMGTKVATANLQFLIRNVNR
jgi:hypothetical protein